MNVAQIRESLLNKIESKLRLEISCEDIKNLAEAYAEIAKRDDSQNLYKSISGNVSNSCMPIWNGDNSDTEGNS